MISIIICSREKDISDHLKSNILQTIGIEYEVVIIDNSTNRYNIFSAYNKGVAQSRFPILLFMHDDIEFHTNNWGHKVISHFDDKKVGSIGVAGTPYFPVNPGGWWSTGIGYLYLLQSENKSVAPEMQDFFPPFDNNREVVALDGVWFCVRKNLFDSIKFDETNFHGFHFYDLDITFQVYNAGYKLKSINNILIHHYSKGTLDKNWFEYLHVFYRKWDAKIPVSCFTIPKSVVSNIEYRVINTYIGDYLQIFGKNSKNKRRAYKTAVKNILKNKKVFFYYKTPFWILKFWTKYLLTFFK